MNNTENLKLTTNAYQFTIFEEYNGWIVDCVYEKKALGDSKRYYYLKSHCKFCNKEKLIRADKRNEYKACACIYEEQREQKKFKKKLEKKLEKIQNTDIILDKEIINKLKQNPDYNFYKIHPNKPFSISNYFLGTYEDFKKYRFEKKKQKNIIIENVIKHIDESKNNIDGIKCPYCGAISMYINACPRCMMSYTKDNSNSIYEKKNLIDIKNENDLYSNKYHNNFSFFNNGKENLVSIKDIPAIYFKENNYLTRVGIIRVEKIDYENQGVIGDFQGIDKYGKTFIIDNVFQKFNGSIFILRNGNIIDEKEIQDNFSNLTYALLVSVDNKKNLYIYNNSELSYIVNDVSEIWGSGTYEIFFTKNDNLNYVLELKNNKISHTNLVKNNGFYSYDNTVIITNPDYITFYFNKTLFKNSIALYEFLKSKKISINYINNEFDDDNTQNYKIEVKSNDYEILDVIYYFINQKTDPLTSFGNGYAIYGYPLYRIIKPILKKISESQKIYVPNDTYRQQLENIIYNYSDSEFNIDKYNYIIHKLINKYSCSEVELIDLLVKKYGIFEVFNLNYFNSKTRLKHLNRHTIKEHVEFIYSNSKYSKIKWKSEFALFKMISFFYPDAIYQYRDNSMQGLILDVFVPSIKTAFEYQGEQHSKRIKFFEKNNLLEERQERDKLKRELCRKNNIKLIEWHSYELINKLILDEKIKSQHYMY